VTIKFAPDAALSALVAIILPFLRVAGRSDSKQAIALLVGILLNPLASLPIGMTRHFSNQAP
jgi:hypothetical protein